LTDQIEEALEARREALEIWTRRGDKLRQGDNLRWMSRFTWSLGRNKQAEGYSIEAVRILESLTPGPELAMAYSNRAQLHMLADEYAPAVLWGSRAIELAEKLGATEILVHALNNVGTAELLAHNEEGRIKLEESLRLALANNLHEHTCRAYTNLADSMVRARNYPGALRWFAEGIAHAIEHELDFCKLYLLAERARTYFEQGDWDRAADDAGFVLESYRVPAITRIAALAVLGHVRVRRGDPDAVRLLNEARELAFETGELQRIAPVVSAQAELAWLRGDSEQAASEARPVLEMARGRRDLWIKGEFTYWIWRAGGVIETVDQIAAPYALQMSGDWQAAAAAWRQVGCPYEEAMALADGDEAAKLSAVEILEKLGAGPALERLRKSLRDTGVRGIPRGPRPSTRENPAGLTNRQLEVLAFMAEGSSNAEIGDRLFISAKTVDHHVSAILAKLEARTRAEAVAIALQSNLIKAK
jgi:DNA-binding CsgD family transcriptional regulator